MKVLHSWLEDYVKIDLNNQELTEKLNLTGTAVEAVESLIDGNIVVGAIKDIRKHPNADKLQIATVYNGQEDLQIVCGAPNIEVGQKVPLAQIGAILPEMEIRKAEIRGIESFGMLCSERELGLSDEHGGIKILPADYEPGKKLAEYLNADSIFELEITPNRGDCLSHLGVAREIAAFTNESIRQVQVEENYADTAAIKIEIKDKELCSQYHALVIKGVKIQESPSWLKNRLISLGQKPINNIVDITNYIMFDLGQPLHAFDLAKIAGGEIIIRRAKEGEKIMTLDDQEHTLTSNDLVIADSDKPIALAGVMGGLNSEIEVSTTDIVLESAEFKATTIRKTAKRMGLSSEASYRFERGIDSGRVKKAMEKAAKLISEIAGGEISRPHPAGEEPQSSSIDVAYDKIVNLLGIEIDEEEVNRILASLGFEVNNGKALIPLWRHDISMWQDLAEEVGRIYGINRIKPLEITGGKSSEKSAYFYKEYIKDILVEEGFAESYTYPFLSQKDLETAKLEAKDLLEVVNPLQKENKFLRNSLIPGLLKAVAKNPSFDQVFLFEIANVFTKETETTNVAVVSSGRNAKQTIEILVKKISDFAGNISIKELSRDDLVRYKIKKPVVYAFELKFNDICRNLKLDGQALELKIDNEEIQYKEVSKYPAVTRDLAFVINKDIKSDAVVSAMKEASENVLLAEVFDEFASEKLGQNRKNVALHLYLQDKTKTITDEEIAIIIEKIINVIETKFQAKLRS